jgi:uncharacterized protein (TIGR03792 family)
VFIEWLRFSVQPELREKFVIVDAEVWTADHAKRKGFLKKEVWISPKHLDEVAIAIYWANPDDWFTIPQPETEATEALFARTFGSEYKLIESAAYQVRKTYQQP